MAPILFRLFPGEALAAEHVVHRGSGPVMDGAAALVERCFLLIGIRFGSPNQRDIRGLL